MSPELPVYPGSTPALYLSIDVGTTHSSVAYCLCVPEKRVEVQTFSNRLAGLLESQIRIPSILYYRPDGSVAAVGNEAASEEAELNAQTYNWAKAEWFKLHLRPESLTGVDIPPLPLNKSATQVFADFLRHLHEITLRHIRDQGMLYQTFLNSSYDTYLILSHPNGWEGRQHKAMRTAAWLSGIVTQEHDSLQRVMFINEGEAGLHFAVYKQLFNDFGALGSEGVAVVDAGGGTIDISAYKKAQFAYVEVARPECYFQGSVYVTRRAKEYLSDIIGKTAHPDMLDFMISSFDRSVKRCFSKKEAERKECQLRTGGFWNKNDSQQIRNGVLSVPTGKVISFFEPAVECIEESLKEIALKHNIKTACFLGGFANNSWVFETLFERLRAYGIILMRPSQAQAAVAEGGIIQTIGLSSVSARVPRSIYGCVINVPYNDNDPEHVSRRHHVQVFHNVDGQPYVTTYFSVLVPKAPIGVNQELRGSYHRRLSLVEWEATRHDDLRINIERYRDQGSASEWNAACTIHAPADMINLIAQKRMSPIGEYIHIEFDIVFKFMVSELHARICWKGPHGYESSLLLSGPAALVYDEDYGV
ncbi:hypothetical protein AX16_005055 [Volvariella volvacea WC 439]|nr:hypothetical protein AX16_005055 [Volvariella volvacea WC 439]